MQGLAATTSRRIGALCNLEHTRATLGAEVNTGTVPPAHKGPDKFLRAVVDFGLPERAATPPSPSCPRIPVATSSGQGDREDRVIREACGCSAGGDVPIRESMTRTPKDRRDQLPHGIPRRRRPGRHGSDVGPTWCERDIEHELGRDHTTSGVVLPETLESARCLHGHAHHDDLAVPVRSGQKKKQTICRTRGAVGRRWPSAHHGFSTNVHPRAVPPGPVIANNGEINTVQGNRN